MRFSDAAAFCIRMGIGESAPRTGGWRIEIPILMQKDAPVRTDWMIGWGGERRSGANGCAGVYGKSRLRIRARRRFCRMANAHERAFRSNAGEKAESNDERLADASDAFQPRARANGLLPAGRSVRLPRSASGYAGAASVGAGTGARAFAQGSGAAVSGGRRAALVACAAVRRAHAHLGRPAVSAVCRRRSTCALPAIRAMCSASLARYLANE